MRCRGFGDDQPGADTRLDKGKEDDSSKLGLRPKRPRMTPWTPEPEAHYEPEQLPTPHFHVDSDEDGDGAASEPVSVHAWTDRVYESGVACPPSEVLDIEVKQQGMNACMACAQDTHTRVQSWCRTTERFAHCSQVGCLISRRHGPVHRPHICRASN